MRRGASPGSGRKIRRACSGTPRLGPPPGVSRSPSAPPYLTTVQRTFSPGEGTRGRALPARREKPRAPHARHATADPHGPKSRHLSVALPRGGPYIHYAQRLTAHPRRTPPRGVV